MIQFDIQYDIISLIFLIIIAYRFFSHKYFPSTSNRLFSVLIFVGVLDLSLDISGTLALYLTAENLRWIPYVLNFGYYIVQMILPTAICLYCLSLLADKRYFKKSTYYLLLLPAIASIITFIVTFCLGKVYTFTYDGASNQLTWNYKEFRFITYLDVVIYLIFGVIVLIKYFKLFSKKQISAISASSVIIFITALIQFFHTRLLITGTGLVLALFITYFSMQDPQRMIDEPTSLFNYRALVEFLKTVYMNKKDFYVVALKLHDLHSFYMLYGRDTGDAILREISGILMSKSHNWAFRFADSSFISVFKNKSSFLEYVNFVDQKKREAFIVNGYHVKFTITIVGIPNSYELSNHETLLRVCENVLSSKMNKDFVGETIVLDRKSLLDYKRNTQIESEIREFLPTGENFQVYYQPIFSLKNNKFCGAEALIRFRSPTLGRVTPGLFIPIIENRGLSAQLDTTVTMKVFDDISNGYFRKLGFDYIHINLSACSFTSKETTLRIIDLAKQFDIDPHFVVFEITETAASMSKDVLMDCVNILTNFGFSLALDDFGTGYANISEVLTLPYSVVKIDKTLTQESATLIDDIVRVFSNFPVEIIAEGVENDKQLEDVKAAGIDAIQGYYFARPMPVDEMADFVNERNNK